MLPQPLQLSVLCRKHTRVDIAEIKLKTGLISGSVSYAERVCFYKTHVQSSRDTCTTVSTISYLTAIAGWPSCLTVVLKTIQFSSKRQFIQPLHAMTVARQYFCTRHVMTWRRHLPHRPSDRLC